MRKRCKLILSLFICYGLISPLFSQNYQVQIAAFAQQIEATFFDYAGFSNVRSKRDYNNFVRYTLGEFPTREAAKKAQCLAQKNGLTNALIIPKEELIYTAKGNSNLLPLEKSPKMEPLYIRAIQFVASDLHLNSSTVAYLEETLQVMQQNENLKLRIVGYASNNERASHKMLSEKRTRVIHNFLLANGIPAYRLKVEIDECPSTYYQDDLVSNKDFEQRIVMTLVDLKEEIVLDTFG